MIIENSPEVTKVFNNLVSGEGVLIGARNDHALWPFLHRHLKVAGKGVLHQSSILKAIGSDLDIFRLSDIDELAFIVDGCGVVRVKRTASGLWNLFFHPKK